MLILAIDTSGKSGGITLAEASEASVHVIESASIAGGTFSAQLIPTLSGLLSKHGHTVKDLGGFAAASGPGSFTGLRVGLSAIKGLAEVLRKPIATVSVLEAVAANLLWTAGEHRREELICRVAMGASRNEVFFAEYDCRQSGKPKLLNESLIPITELAERVQAWGGAAHLVTPDASVIAALKELVRDPQIFTAALGGEMGTGGAPVARPSSEDIARVGAGKLFAGETVAVDALDANYLRRSDAEIFFKGVR